MGIRRYNNLGRSKRFRHFCKKTGRKWNTFYNLLSNLYRWEPYFLEIQANIGNFESFSEKEIFVKILHNLCENTSFAICANFLLLRARLIYYILTFAWLLVSLKHANTQDVLVWIVSTLYLLSKVIISPLFHWHELFVLHALQSFLINQCLHQIIKKTSLRSTI